MLKTIIKKTLILGTLTTIISVVYIGVAHAAGSDAGAVTKLFGFANFFDFIAQAIAQFFFQLQTIASWLIILAGYLLNFSVNLTLNIKTFVDNTPAIYTTWKALRDITGLVIIFFLLYEAIQLIIGIQSAKFKQLAVNIVIAGVLINFSFFFAGLGIDASNVISVQLYKAIAPASSLNETRAGLAADGVTQIANHGGLSDIFMQALKIPALYDVTGQRTAASAATGGGTWTQPFQIMLIGVTSVIIMVTAAFSFALAALMFIVRFVILIFLLAFSPIWFMSFISPEIKKYGGKWVEYYKSMLIIMPVYLLLMYMSLNVLSSQTFFGNLKTSSNTGTISSGTAMIDQALAATGATGASSNWYDGILGIAVNAVIVIMMMNIPLLGAISIGGGAVKFLNAEKFGADAIWKKVGNYAGTNTAGRFGNWADKKMENTRFGNSILGRDIRSSTVGALATSKMGGRSFDETTKLAKDVAKKNKEIERSINLNRVINNSQSTISDHKTALHSMTEKERLALGANKLKDIKFAKHLKGSDYDAIKKSDDFSDEEKKDIANARKAALTNAITNGETEVIKHMVDNMDGKELLKLDDATLREQAVIEHLKPSQLKTLADEGMNDATKRFIGNYITGATWATPHKARGYINKNSGEWT